MTIDTKQLTTDIIAAMKGVLMGELPSVATLVTGEAVKLAQTAATIAELSASGAIDNDRYAILLDMQRHATRAVLLSAEGVGIIVAEQAVNAAVAVVVAAVNKAVGFSVL